eukprot:gene8038-8900_t
MEDIAWDTQIYKTETENENQLQEKLVSGMLSDKNVTSTGICWLQNDARSNGHHYVTGSESGAFAENNKEIDVTGNGEIEIRSSGIEWENNNSLFGWLPTAKKDSEFDYFDKQHRATTFISPNSLACADFEYSHYPQMIKSDDFNMKQEVQITELGIADEEGPYEQGLVESMDASDNSADENNLEMKKQIVEFPELSPQDTSLLSTDEGSSISSSSSTGEEQLWDMENYCSLTSLVEEIDSYLVEQEINNNSYNYFQEHSEQTNEGDKTRTGGNENQGIRESIGVMSEVPKSDATTIDRSVVMDNIPQVDLNSKGLQLLIEAVRTQSFTPIYSLLLSALNNRENNIGTEVPLSNISSTSTGQDTPCLSTQSSYDSELTSSDYEEFSRMDNNNSLTNEANFSWSQSDQCLDGLQSVPTISETEAQCDKMFARNEERNVLKRPLVVDDVFAVENKIPRIEPSQVQSLQAKNELDTIIENFISTTEKCDLQSFEKLLDKEHSSTVNNENTKVFKNASTETSRIVVVEENSTFYKMNNSVLQEHNRKSCQPRANNRGKGSRGCKQEKRKGTKHSTSRPGPNKCYHLWDFLRELLEDSNKNETYANVIQWSDKQAEEFKLIDTKRLAELWGAKKRLMNMNYDKLSRSLRYYTKLDILRKVAGKRLHFQFGNGRMWRKLQK